MPSQEPVLPQFRREIAFMCSISGVWNLDNAQVDVERAQRLSDAMKHRGPDGYGMHVDRAAGLVLSNNLA